MRCCGNRRLPRALVRRPLCDRLLAAARGSFHVFDFRRELAEEIFRGCATVLAVSSPGSGVNSSSNSIFAAAPVPQLALHLRVSSVNLDRALGSASSSMISIVARSRLRLLPLSSLTSGTTLVFGSLDAASTGAASSTARRRSGGLNLDALTSCYWFGVRFRLRLGAGATSAAPAVFRQRRRLGHFLHHRFPFVREIHFFSRGRAARLRRAGTAWRGRCPARAARRPLLECLPPARFWLDVTSGISNSAGLRRCRQPSGADGVGTSSTGTASADAASTTGAGSDRWRRQVR